MVNNMGLYNVLFGKNPHSKILLVMLDIDQPNGNWESGRFRDIWVEERGVLEPKEKVIALYTRNGGGNRDDCWDDEKEKRYWNEDKQRCDCPACTINENLPKHPNYLYDEDDDFDATYNTAYFSIPEGYELIVDMMNKPKEKWDELFRKLENSEDHIDDPDVQRALNVGKCLFGNLVKLLQDTDQKKD